MKIFAKILCFVIIALGVALSYLGYEAYQFLQTPPTTQGSQVYFDVLPGQNVTHVAQNLAKAKLITNAKYFTYLARINQLDNKLKAGRFALNTGWLPTKVLDTLVHGHPVLYRVTVPEGLTVWQVGKLLTDKGFLEYEPFMEVVRDPIFLRNFGIPFEVAEGFLMPDTYLLKQKGQEELAEESAPEDKQATPKDGSIAKDTPTVNQAQAKKDNQEAKSEEAKTKQVAKDSKPTKDNQEAKAKLQEDVATKKELQTTIQEGEKTQKLTLPKKLSIKEYLAGKPANYRQAWRICARLVDNFWQKADPLWPNAKRPTANKLKEWVILASIVEKETAVPSERARVAGVYKNRLDRKMLLQADPTIIYGLGPKFHGKLLYRHLDDAKNPYNTYQHQGLPPTPICSFGREALKAAIYPEAHNFLYFVAKGGNGEHTFSKNLAEHNRAVEQYRKWVRTHPQ